jgi:hypothetical protein
MHREGRGGEVLVDNVKGKGHVGKIRIKVQLSLCLRIRPFRHISNTHHTAETNFVS